MTRTMKVKKWVGLKLLCRGIRLPWTRRWAVYEDPILGELEKLREANNRLRVELREHVQYENELVARTLTAESRVEVGAMRAELPGLSPAELERVAILADQCGQLVQICGKVLRHGYESCSPFDPRCKPNRMLLEREVGAMRGAIDLLVNRGDLQHSEIQVWRKRKRANLAQWTHHQGFLKDGSGEESRDASPVESSAQ